MLKPIALTLTLLFLACSARAQDETEHLSPFAQGAGRTYAISSRGLDAVGLNPSLLALGTPRPFEITLAPISSLGINAGPSLSQINGVSHGFQDTELSSQTLSNTPDSLQRGDSTRLSIANLLGNNGLSSSIDVRVFGMSYFDPNLGGFALTWTMHAALEASIPNGLLDYIGVGAVSKIAEGYQLPPQALNVQGIWYSEYTLSYARTVYGTPSSGDLQLLSGVGLKYLTGIAVIQMNPGVFSINSPPDLGGGHYVVGVNYQIRSAYPAEFNFNNLPTTFSLNLLENASAGNGVGADIGFTLGNFDSTHNAPWELAVSVTDIGSIRWNKNVSVRSADTTVSPSTQNVSQDSINAQLKALGGKLDTSTGSFTTPLPTTLHIAGAMDLAEIGIHLDGVALGAVAEYALGLTNTVGAPTNGRFGFALTLEDPGSAFSFHTAVGFTTQDGTSDLTFAIGVGIGNRILFDVGTDGLTGLFSATGHTDAAFGLKVLL
jgi:Family of unknown function (DUF5723)